ncbi:hypothetical protein LTR17_019956 [Elasticomyces elasticus]|nr:hypothetical protein LTR17_019956 [Elasticomyces elasticus]
MTMTQAINLGSDGQIPAIMTAVGISNLTNGLANGYEHEEDNSASSVGNGTREQTDPYTIPPNDQLTFTPRKLRVITGGAGFSGLMLAHKFQHRFSEMQSIIQHKIFEARHDMGGTWLVNTYLGVQCDDPSHTYFYSSGPEILRNIKRTAEKWDPTRDVQLHTKVVSAIWRADSGMWKVTVESQGERRDESAEVLISAQGVLDSCKRLSIPGIESFAGHRVNSADWDHSFNYPFKMMAVVGNGSSDVQIVPQLIKLPGTTVTNFARGPA